MASVGTVHLATNNSANTNSYNATISLVGSNVLLVVCVVASATVAAGTMTSDGPTFTKVTSTTNSGDTLYVFIANALTSAESVTVTFDCTGDNATGASIIGIELTGMSKLGTQGIKQFKVAANQSAGGTPAVTFDAACSTSNPTIGMVGNDSSPAGLTPPTDWTEGRDTGYTSPDTGQEIVYRNSGFTGTTITWGSTSATAFGAIILEVDGSSVPVQESLNESITASDVRTPTATAGLSLLASASASDSRSPAASAAAALLGSAIASDALAAGEAVARALEVALTLSELSGSVAQAVAAREESQAASISSAEQAAGMVGLTTSASASDASAEQASTPLEITASVTASDASADQATIPLDLTASASASASSAEQATSPLDLIASSLASDTPSAAAVVALALLLSGSTSDASTALASAVAALVEQAAASTTEVYPPSGESLSFSASVTLTHGVVAQAVAALLEAQTATGEPVPAATVAFTLTLALAAAELPAAVQVAVLALIQQVAVLDLHDAGGGQTVEEPLLASALVSVGAEPLAEALGAILAVASGSDERALAALSDAPLSLSSALDALVQLAPLLRPGVRVASATVEPVLSIKTE